MILAALLSSTSAPDDEIAHVLVSPTLWAAVLSKWEARPVGREDVRVVTCAGFEAAQMLCGWQQLEGDRW